MVISYQPQLGLQRLKTSNCTSLWRCFSKPWKGVKSDQTMQWWCKISTNWKDTIWEWTMYYVRIMCVYTYIILYMCAIAYVFKISSYSQQRPNCRYIYIHVYIYIPCFVFAPAGYWVTQWNHYAPSNWTIWSKCKCLKCLKPPSTSCLSVYPY